MIRVLFVLPFVVLSLVFVLFFTRPVFSDELDELNKEIAELQKALVDSERATQPHEKNLENLTDRLASIEFQVAQIEDDLTEKREFIKKGYEDFESQQDLLNQAIRSYYIKNHWFTPLLVFISAKDAGNITRVLAYQKRDAGEDKATITNIAIKLADLEEREKILEDEETRLAGVKTLLAQEKTEVEELVTGAKAYQASLTEQIAELTARQQEIINARSGSFNATIGDSDLADDYNASIAGFRESAPSGYFAVFSFGAHTHRKGMSQYGARGRAEQGKDHKQILQEYYGKEPVNKETGGSIRVSGHGEMDFEGRYLFGIAEMPSSWHIEALKAQAIAARTYAYRYKQEGKEICTTEACQVYNSGKADNPPDAWKRAVEETRGMVLEDVVTYYASTHGGFASPIGWDTTDGGGGSNFVDKAYDKLGGSPWLYKAWYTQGYSPSSNKCGRSNPWLSPEELADIVNAAIALKTGGIDTGRITPVTTSCWPGNPYSMEELRNIVSSHGGISSATSVSVAQGNGTTNSVTVNGITIDGADFKKAFNLRAPGYLSIPQSGFAFYNIEKK